MSRGFLTRRGFAPNPRERSAGTPLAPFRARETRTCAPWPSPAAPSDTFLVLDPMTA